MTTTANQPKKTESPKWATVFALALCAGTLIASEFMPVNQLSPLAKDLHLSDGQAGRAIAVSGFFAVMSSLSLSSLSRGINRRHVLLFMTALMIVADLFVVVATNVGTFMVGRALIGVVVGGFWSMSAATVMRLVPVSKVPQGLAVVNAGTALATTIAIPLGSFLGQFTGWRVAFSMVLPLAVLAFVWLFVQLPSMPSSHNSEKISIFRLLGRQHIVLAMLAVMVFFLGQFSLTTYLRPFLEKVTGMNTSTISFMQMMIGSTGLLGNFLLLRTKLVHRLVVIPLMMAVIALALTVVGNISVAVAVLLSAWGFIASSAPAAWWLWLSETLPNDAEAGGGLMVAVIQLAITIGANIGGLLFDSRGYRSTFTVSAATLCFSAVLAVLAWRASHRQQLQISQ